MSQRNTCASDLGVEVEERFLTRLLCHLERPGAAKGGRFGTGGHTSVHASGVAGNPRTQWDVIEDEELPAVPRSTPKAIETPSLRSGGLAHY